MDEQIITLIQSIVTIGVPSLVTIVSYIKQSSQSKKHAAKQSILQMIMEDQLNWELFHKFPTNWGDIQDEYSVYSKNGGNGEITKRVHEYNDWYLKTEAKIARRSK